MSLRTRHKMTERTIFLVLFLSFAYFYQGGGANQNARLDQIRSVVELGQLNLGRFAPSHDIVQVGNRLYPNKAPGTTLMGVTPYWLVSRLRPALVRAYSEDFFHLFSCWLTTVSVTGLLSALGGVVFFRLLGLFHEGVFPRLAAVFALFLGTPLFAYSTVFYGHVPSTVFALISFYLLYRYLLKEPGNKNGGRYVFLAGLAGGGAIVTEYPVAFIVTVLSIFCFGSFITSRGGWAKKGKYILLFLLGLAGPAAALLTYNTLVFQNPFYIAYFDHDAAAHAAYRRGPILGFAVRGREFVRALYQTSFGPYRGLFHISPFLILVFPGSYYLARRKGGRALLACLLPLCLVYFLLNVIYPYWHGGRALGPRHAMEILPWLALLAFFFVLRYPRLSALAVAVSIFLNLAATSVRPEEFARRPFHDLYLPAFLGGNLSINRETTFQVNNVIPAEFNAFNLGMVAGLRGQASLYPLYLLWLLAGAVLWFAGKKGRDPSLPPPTPAPPWAKFLAVLLILLIGVGVANLFRSVDIERMRRELEGAGEFRLPPAETPAPHIHVRTTPGHRTQVWQVTAPVSPGDRIRVKAQHAAAGDDGGFYILAYSDTSGDGRPDTEISRSPLLTAIRTGDWSWWKFTAPEGRIFVGNTWNEGAQVFFDRLGWPHRDLSPTMYYATRGLPSLSTGPRSTNLAVEILSEE